MVKSTTSKKRAINDDDIGEEDKIKEVANASIRDGRSAVWNDMGKLATSDKNETKAKLLLRMHASLCLAKWKIDGKVGTFTLDNASYNNTMASEFKRQLVRNGNELLFCGEYFQIRCCCHIINLIVQDGLKLIYSVVDKIRAIGKHFRAAIDHVVEKDSEIKMYLLDDDEWKKVSLKFVEYSFITLYGEFHANEKVKEVKSMLCNLLRECRDVDGGGVGESDEVSHDNRTSSASFFIDNDRMANVGSWMSSQQQNVNDKSQLDLYLEEKNVDFNSKIDVLIWWKNNGTHRHPQLAALACDILAIPISSVPSESDFSMGKKAN
uniref:HAT C-terminal dimerisation domain-containing protein n=1 Tax=Chenopodium quinoa TaxID=63459 RepID=A0A803MMC1_CHEQI